MAVDVNWDDERDTTIRVKYRMDMTQDDFVEGLEAYYQMCEAATTSADAILDMRRCRHVPSGLLNILRELLDAMADANNRLFLVGGDDVCRLVGAFYFAYPAYEKRVVFANNLFALEDHHDTGPLRSYEDVEADRIEAAS